MLYSEKGAWIQNNINIRNMLETHETIALVPWEKKAQQFLSSVTNWNNLKMYAVIAVWIWEQSVGRKESCAHFVLREALVAVPLSAAGWQQSTAVASKLKL